MKKILILSAFGLIFFCQTNAANLQAYLSYTTFYSPTEGPYIETYLTIDANSVVFAKNDSGDFQSTIQVTLIFRKGDVISDFKKIDLMSPVVKDTSSLDFSFTDQQRFLLPEGNYVVEIQLMDKNIKDAKPYKTTESLTISFPNDKASVSGIEFVDSYKKTVGENVLSKNGYDLVPLSVNFFPQSDSTLTFYAEVYNSAKSFAEADKFMIRYYLEAYESAKVQDAFAKVRVEKAKPVIVILDEFNIAKLPSGNYDLVIEIRDKDNNIVSYNKAFFQRSNPVITYNLASMSAIEVPNSFMSAFANEDTLKDYIKSLYPISTEMEKGFASQHLKTANLETLQKFFYNFWLNRNSIDPAAAWNKYLLEVEKVNKAYGTGIRKGYETDRGRVYLEYGPPNQITQSAIEPQAYPYEIWHYYTLNTQKNRKFVFYCTNSASNDFTLLHSDAFGELNDPQWKIKLSRFDTFNPNFDQIDVPDYFGDKSDEYFKNPR